MEADAKLLQSKEEELLKRKEALRNRLAQLRKERKDLRAAIEVNAGVCGGWGWEALMDHAPVSSGALEFIQLTFRPLCHKVVLPPWGAGLVGSPGQHRVG